MWMGKGLLSNLHHFHDWDARLLCQSGCTFMFRNPWFSSMDMLLTADPTNVNHIFNVNFANYPKGHGFFKIFDVLGDGIFTSDGE